jgi:hypothetical protein
MELKQGVQAELPSLLDLQLYIPVIVAVIVVVLYLWGTSCFIIDFMYVKYVRYNFNIVTVFVIVDFLQTFFHT